MSELQNISVGFLKWPPACHLLACCSRYIRISLSRGRETLQVLRMPRGRGWAAKSFSSVFGEEAGWLAGWCGALALSVPCSLALLTWAPSPPLCPIFGPRTATQAVRPAPLCPNPALTLPHAHRLLTTPFSIQKHVLSTHCIHALAQLPGDGAVIREPQTTGAQRSPLPSWPSLRVSGWYGMNGGS